MTGTLGLRVIDASRSSQALYRATMLRGLLGLIRPGNVNIWISRVPARISSQKRPKCRVILSGQEDIHGCRRYRSGSRTMISMTLLQMRQYTSAGADGVPTYSPEMHNQPALNDSERQNVNGLHARGKCEDHPN